MQPKEIPLIFLPSQGKINDLEMLEVCHQIDVRIIGKKSHVKLPQQQLFIVMFYLSDKLGEFEC